MTPVLLSLGANLGDARSTLNTAIDELHRRRLLSDMHISPLFLTEPVGYADQPSFLNCSVQGMTCLDAWSLRLELGDIEIVCGRQVRPQWHERELDIDIILFGDQVIHDGTLTIPHPRMFGRRFVLAPSALVAGTMIHPERHETILELLDECADTASIRLSHDWWWTFPAHDNED